MHQRQSRPIRSIYLGVQIMFKKSGLAVLGAAILFGTAAWAKAPASAPAGTTGMCKDGSYTSAASKSGACSGHDGVKKWYGAAAGASDSGNADQGATTSKSKKKSATAAAGSSTAAPASAVADSNSADKAGSSGKSTKKTSSAAASSSSAAAPAGPATGVCKDGSTTSAASKSGACSGHGGVKQWYASGASSSSAAATAAPAGRSSPAASGAAAPAAAATGDVQGWQHDQRRVQERGLQRPRWCEGLVPGSGGRRRGCGRRGRLRDDEQSGRRAPAVLCGGGKIRFLHASGKSGTGRWTRTGMGEPSQQGVPLPERSVVRQD